MDGMVIVAEEAVDDAIHFFGPVSAQTQGILFNLRLGSELSRGLSWHDIAHRRDVGRLFVVVRIIQQGCAVLQEE